jgi:hypothetical protein
MESTERRLNEEEKTWPTGYIRIGERFYVKPYPKDREARTVSIDPAVANLVEVYVRDNDISPDELQLPRRVGTDAATMRAGQDDAPTRREATAASQDSARLSRYRWMSSRRNRSCFPNRRQGILPASTWS